MIRCTLVLLLFSTVVACKKGKVEKDEIQEPLDLNVADEIAYLAKLKAAGAFQLFLMKTDGSGLRTLLGDSLTNEPLAVSHDGNKFLFQPMIKTKRVGCM
ncbi:hypothetical protein [Paraflavitalea speifideaquila]|uniref:hypothetical protein n=1 Tax=Paraflavitalea speifideaquila TaxID=3076558 RepID=UPI0028E217E6|nr:hypothetical protein [Paraflavitalea speifideiaquila]